MCRIIVNKKFPLPFEQLGELMDGLIEQNGGDGAGFIYTAKDKICGVKSDAWGKNHVPMLSEMMLALSKESDLPTIFHTRKMSSGGGNGYYNHPHSVTPTDDWGEWKDTDSKFKESVRYIEGSGGLMVHNGTLTKEQVTNLRFHMAMVQPSVAMNYWNGLNDTMLMGELLEHRKQDLNTLQLFPFGVVVGALKGEKANEVFVSRTDDRSLYLVALDKERWMLVSSVTPRFHEFIVKSEAKVWVVPRGSYKNLNAFVAHSIDKVAPENINVIKNTAMWIPSVTKSNHNGYHQRGA